MRHIDHNRKLIKDESWKDIHMTGPRRIVKFSVISMSCYIIYQSSQLIISLMMYLGFQTYFFEESCHNQTELTKVIEIL